ncbi:glycine zipper domain-containing protein [Terricaulis sp.]|uniref:glycine zipper domain-containing protein n=1 Tax=Terricaulis sp. TaxID=2768686 RepID=UPI003784FDBD
MIRAALFVSAALLASACTATGNTERSAATGAVLGGVAGAVIGNNVGDGDAGTGALVGAAVGAAAGAYAGCVQDGRCGGDVNRRQRYDERSGRYYFQDPRSGQYFYENGEPYP